MQIDNDGMNGKVPNRSNENGVEWINGMTMKQLCRLRAHKNVNESNEHKELSHVKDAQVPRGQMLSRKKCFVASAALAAACYV